MTDISNKLTAYHENLKNLYEGIEEEEPDYALEVNSKGSSTTNARVSIYDKHDDATSAGGESTSLYVEVQSNSFPRPTDDEHKCDEEEDEEDEEDDEEKADDYGDDEDEIEQKTSSKSQAKGKEKSHDDDDEEGTGSSGFSFIDVPVYTVPNNSKDAVRGTQFYTEI